MPLMHTDREFEGELDRLRAQITTMGRRVCEMLADGVRAFQSRDGMLARQVVDRDADVDRLEVETDDLCLSILARRQPMGSDLRFVTAAMKLVTDLERIGDLCVNVCERTLEIAETPDSESIDDLSEMAADVQRMVRGALEAFLADDADAARRLIEQDRRVDALNAQLFRQLLNCMAGDPAQVFWATRVQAVAKCLERIGDHATNLAEMVIFRVQGRDIRHTGAFEHQRHPRVRGVLFLCVHNAARSQMAEGWARTMLPPDVAVWSAGSNPARVVDPRAVEAMREVGIDISEHKPKRISEVPLGQINTIITLCAEEICVTLPGIETTQTWVLPDPAAMSGDDAEVREGFRRVRDELRRRIRALLANTTSQS